ncbi:hypothetical protein [Ruania albidiflava]|uniref:hypothetical protein n=1 Tax=Ruania albidiflava TaxID=366586 RepID=UPI000429D2C1|nr:hypothetical protein [Ruania albidiflava]
MSVPPPAPGVPPTPPPTAELPWPGESFGAQPVTRPRRGVFPVLTGLLGVAVGAGLALAIALPLTLDGSPSSALLTEAVEACDSPDGITVQDHGGTLAFDHRGEDEVIGGDIADIMCVFGELDMPSRISTHMGQTTSMDGRQSATWDDLEIQWSYHPDRGMDGMITVVSE